MSARNSSLIRPSIWATSASARLVAGTHSAMVTTFVVSRSKVNPPSGFTPAWAAVTSSPTGAVVLASGTTAAALSRATWRTYSMASEVVRRTETRLRMVSARRPSVSTMPDCSGVTNVSAEPVPWVPEVIRPFTGMGEV